MTVEQVVQRTLASEPELVAATAGAVPKAWGRLAARGVLVFRDLVGRVPTHAERRTLWAQLWEAVRRVPDTSRSCRCPHDPLAESAHAICEVCDGMLLCLDCARTHYCTSTCRDRGCIAGLCVREVRDGVAAASFGVR